MKDLVIAVSLDSSLALLGKHADVMVLDQKPVPGISNVYETIYIRSHFSHPDTLPQNFRAEIDDLIEEAGHFNPTIQFIDSMDTVDKIVEFEDKWQQYQTFTEFMPYTKLYEENMDISGYARPIYKNRLSSRGAGVTWDKSKITQAPRNWIVQESLDIQEELRIYIIFGEVYPVGAVKKSMSEGDKAEGINSRQLTQDEIEFSLSIIRQAPGLDMVGIDIARTTSGKLYLMEVNRSPGFAKFYELTGTNLADELYSRLESKS